MPPTDVHTGHSSRRGIINTHQACNWCCAGNLRIAGWAAAQTQYHRAWPHRCGQLRQSSHACAPAAKWCALQWQRGPPLAHPPCQWCHVQVSHDRCPEARHSQRTHGYAPGECYSVACDVSQSMTNLAVGKNIAQGVITPVLHLPSNHCVIGQCNQCWVVCRVRGIATSPTSALTIDMACVYACQSKPTPHDTYVPCPCLPRSCLGSSHVCLFQSCC